MKALVIDFGSFTSLYLYPNDIDDIEEWTDYLNTCEEQFVKMSVLMSRDNVYPYFTDDNIEEQYVNLAAVTTYQETEIEIMSRDEYDRRLAECVDAICPNCAHYEEDSQGDNLSGHRDEMRLDGVCPNFTPRGEDNE